MFLVDSLRSHMQPTLAYFYLCIVLRNLIFCCCCFWISTVWLWNGLGGCLWHYRKWWTLGEVSTFGRRSGDGQCTLTGDMATQPLPFPPFPATVRLSSSALTRGPDHRHKSNGARQPHTETPSHHNLHLHTDCLPHAYYHSHIKHSAHMVKIKLLFK